MAVNPELYKQYNSSLIELIQLKAGDRYYDPYDSLIYVMLGIDEIDDVNHTISYTKRLFKSRRIQKCTVYGTDTNYRCLVYRYKKHDKPSFNAGFKAAMDICTQHMGVFDLQNAGVEDDIKRFMSMQESYNKWKQNR